MAKHAFRLEISAGRGTGKAFSFAQPLVRIGRTPDNDLVLYDTGVSRRHCEILSDNKGFSVRDMGSANGTLLNERLVTESRIKPGDRIKVGPITFVLAETDPPDPSESSDRFFSRPKDTQERKEIEQQHTRALEPPPGFDPRLLHAPATPGGRFLEHPRRLWDRFAQKPRTTQLAMVIGSVIVASGVGTSIYLAATRAPPDRSAEIFALTRETAASKFGHGNVDIPTLDRANFRFDYQGGRATLSYAAGGIESGDELEVRLNGTRIGFVDMTLGWAQGLETPLPRSSLRPGVNVLTFNNTKTPAQRERWGVTQVEVLQQPLPPLDETKAKELLGRGKDAYETRSVAPQNLYRSIQYFQEAKLHLEIAEQPLALMAEVEAALQRARRELENRHNSHLLAAQKALRFGDRSQAAEAIRELLRYYPDPKDSRHQRLKKRLVRILGDTSP